MACTGMACQKKFGGDVTPTITFKSISPAIAKEAKDTVRITLGFLDGDGDLGPLKTSDNDTNVFIIDKRSGGSSIAFAYRLPYITPPGDNKAIKGEIELRIPSILRRPEKVFAGQNDTAAFYIQIADRAKHRSNMVITTKVIVVP